MISFLERRIPVPRSSAGSRAKFKRVAVPCAAGVRLRQTKIDFGLVNRAAIPALPAILARLLPGGSIEGREFVALNPKRADRRLGSFKINLRSGRWCDFATGDKGGDPVSLVAYLADMSQGQAARSLARMLGIDVAGS